MSNAKHDVLWPRIPVIENTIPELSLDSQTPSSAYTKLLLRCTNMVLRKTWKNYSNWYLRLNLKGTRCPEASCAAYPTHSNPSLGSMCKNILLYCLCSNEKQGLQESYIQLSLTMKKKKKMKTCMLRNKCHILRHVKSVVRPGHEHTCWHELDLFVHVCHVGIFANDDCQNLQTPTLYYWETTTSILYFMTFGNLRRCVDHWRRFLLDWLSSCLGRKNLQLELIGSWMSALTLRNFHWNCRQRKSIHACSLAGHLSCSERPIFPNIDWTHFPKQLKFCKGSFGRKYTEHGLPVQSVLLVTEMLEGTQQKRDQLQIWMTTVVISSTVERVLTLEA